MIQVGMTSCTGPVNGSLQSVGVDIANVGQFTVIRMFLDCVKMIFRDTSATD